MGEPEAGTIATDSEPEDSTSEGEEPTQDDLDFVVDGDSPSEDGSYVDEDDSDDQDQDQDEETIEESSREDSDQESIDEYRETVDTGRQIAGNLGEKRTTKEPHRFADEPTADDPMDDDDAADDAADDGEGRSRRGPGKPPQKEHTWRAAKDLRDRCVDAENDFMAFLDKLDRQGKLDGRKGKFAPHQQRIINYDCEIQKERLQALQAADTLEKQKKMFKDNECGDEKLGFRESFINVFTGGGKTVIELALAFRAMLFRKQLRDAFKYEPGTPDNQKMWLGKVLLISPRKVSVDGLLEQIRLKRSGGEFAALNVDSYRAACEEKMSDLHNVLGWDPEDVLELAKHTIRMKESSKMLTIDNADSERGGHFETAWVLAATSSALYDGVIGAIQETIGVGVWDEGDFGSDPPDTAKKTGEDTWEQEKTKSMHHFTKWVERSELATVYYCSATRNNMLENQLNACRYNYREVRVGYQELQEQFFVKRLVTRQLKCAELETEFAKEQEQATAEGDNDEENNEDSSEEEGQHRRKRRKRGRVNKSIAFKHKLRKKILRDVANLKIYLWAALRHLRDKRVKDNIKWSMLVFTDSAKKIKETGMPYPQLVANLLNEGIEKLDQSNVPDYLKLSTPRGQDGSIGGIGWAIANDPRVNQERDNLKEFRRDGFVSCKLTDRSYDCPNIGVCLNLAGPASYPSFLQGPVGRGIRRLRRGRPSVEQMVVNIKRDMPDSHVDELLPPPGVQPRHAQELLVLEMDFNEHRATDLYATFQKEEGLNIDPSKSQTSQTLLPRSQDPADTPGDPTENPNGDGLLTAQQPIISNAPPKITRKVTEKIPLGSVVNTAPMAKASWGKHGEKGARELTITYPMVYGPNDTHQTASETCYSLQDSFGGTHSFEHCKGKPYQAYKKSGEPEWHLFIGAPGAPAACGRNQPIHEALRMCPKGQAVQMRVKVADILDGDVESIQFSKPITLDLSPWWVRDCECEAKMHLVQLEDELEDEQRCVECEDIIDKESAFRCEACGKVQCAHCLREAVAVPCEVSLDLESESKASANALQKAMPPTRLLCDLRWDSLPHGVQMDGGAVLEVCGPACTPNNPCDQMSCTITKVQFVLFQPGPNGGLEMVGLRDAAPDCQLTLRANYVGNENPVEIRFDNKQAAASCIEAGESLEFQDEYSVHFKQKQENTSFATIYVRIALKLAIECLEGKRAESGRNDWMARAKIAQLIHKEFTVVYAGPVHPNEYMSELNKKEGHGTQILRQDFLPRLQCQNRNKNVQLVAEIRDGNGITFETVAASSSPAFNHLTQEVVLQDGLKLCAIIDDAIGGRSCALEVTFPEGTSQGTSVIKFDSEEEFDKHVKCRQHNHSWFWKLPEE